MGVIIKQSFWGTFIAYTGVLVGYFNALYFRAEYFTLEQIGLFSLITANAMMISPLSSFGMGSSYLKYFPSFSKEDNRKFFTYLFLITLIGNGIILFIGYLLRDVIAMRYVNSAPSYIQYLAITGIIIVSNSLFELFFGLSRSILKVIFPSFLRDVYLRLGSLLCVIGYGADWWDFDYAVMGLGMVYLSALLYLFFQLIVFHGFRFDFQFDIITKDWKKNLLKFGSYSMLLAASFAFISNVSYDQITSILGSEANGIFITCFFIAAIVEMPKRNMAKVINPLLSSEFEKKNLEQVKSLYQRSSITMSVLGMLIFIGIVTNLHDLFKFIPKGDAFSTGYWVVIFICLAKLAVMVSSFAGEIINFSHLYKYNLFFQVLAAFLMAFLNYLMIPIWGIEGAGISYFMVIVLHIVIKIVFVRHHFGMSPFVKSHLVLIAISLVIIALAFLFNPGIHPIFSIGIRSVLTIILFLVLIYRFKISEDINKLIHSTFERFLKIKLNP